jgi:hypothetical protein
MNRKTVTAVIAALLFWVVLHRANDLRVLSGDRGTRIALVAMPGAVTAAGDVRDAYTETLRENGIPFDWIAATDLSLLGPRELAADYSALVFPDGMSAQIPEEAVGALDGYVKGGGTVAVISDAGTRSLAGAYRPNSLFTNVSGVDSMRYQELRAQAFESGTLQFADPQAAARWGVPSGKLEGDRLSSYGYGALTYPFSRAKVEAPATRVDAANGKVPLVTERRIGRGRVAYIALPLGYLRAHSDAFPMTFLTQFLTAQGETPHLIAAPDGIGALIMDMHIDSSVEFHGIPNLVRRNLLRRGVPMEFDVTAGPDRDRLGDGLGFDACGKGRGYLETLAHYGTIGSHGGWAHNEFARDVRTNQLSFDQIRALVDENGRCLSSVTHQPVLSFAAPQGAHPQPLMTNVLESLNINSYYYTGDTGAPVERPFFNGKIVGDHSWAFPIMPMGNLASIGEMRATQVPPAQMQRWFCETADYAAARRSIYLVYSHSYDLNGAPDYAAAFGAFEDHLEALQRDHRLQMTDMPRAAAFMERFTHTEAAFSHTADGVDVRLSNPAGLRAIAFALPSAWLAGGAAAPAGFRRVGIDGAYTIFTVTGDATTLETTFPGRSV